jgi:acetyl esterase
MKMKYHYGFSTFAAFAGLAVFSGLAALCGLAVLSGCNRNSNATMGSVDSATVRVDTIAKPEKTAVEIKPTNPPPDWGKSMKPEMQVVIDRYLAYKDPPTEKSSPELARKLHTSADALKDVMREFSVPTPVSQVDTSGRDIPVAGGNIHVRIYTPKAGKAPFPIVVYYHGGGFVLGDLESSTTSAQGLAEQAGAVVVSVAYRLAPEHKFPTAHNDAFAAYQWAVQNSASIKGDPKKIAVAGESAGGNLAAAVSIMARDKKIMLPLHEVLIYPVAQANMNTDSYTKYANAVPLNKASMEWFLKNYLQSMGQAKDPRISLVNANLKGLPPTTIINAEIDPLADDGKLLEDKLKAADVKVDRKVYDGVTHMFFGMVPVVPEANQAQAYAADQLKSAFK